MFESRRILGCVSGVSEWTDWSSESHIREWEWEALIAFADALFSRVLRDSTPRYVGQLVGRPVGWLVGPSPFYFFGIFELFEHTAPAQMPWWPSLALLLPTHAQLG